jgi:lysophospholipase L1-like esterase
MKKILIAILITASIVLLSSACDEYNELTAPVVNTGSVDFTRFVSIGNSLTMAEQSSSVFETSQMYSFGRLIANQVGTTYEQATFSDPGTGGRLEISSIDLVNGSADIVTNPNQGLPTNLTYPAPYNNLGVKGAFLTDVLNARDANSCYTANFGVPNPLFDAVLRGLGTQLELAIAQQPTLVTLWIGNNDILAFATRGGFGFFPITDVQQFGVNYKAILDNLQAVGVQVVMANIPDVKNIPFFKTVGPGIGQKLQQNQIPGMVYKTFSGIGQATVNDLFSLNVLILLTGSSAASLIGDVTGAYYTLNGIPVPPDVNTAFPFGLAPENPWPNNLILDPTEMAAVDQTVTAYNDIIESEASTRSLAVVDIHDLLNRIGEPSGIVVNGITFTSDFITGNTYSLDGVHPTTQGYGIVANAFIETINNKYGASIPLIKVATLPGSLIFEGVSLGKYGIPAIPHGALDHVIF